MSWVDPKRIYAAPSSAKPKSGISIPMCLPKKSNDYWTIPEYVSSPLSCMPNSKMTIAINILPSDVCDILHTKTYFTYVYIYINILIFLYIYRYTHVICVINTCLYIIIYRESHLCIHLFTFSWVYILKYLDLNCPSPRGGAMHGTGGDRTWPEIEQCGLKAPNLEGCKTRLGEVLCMPLVIHLTMDIYIKM